jgi:hypothetical protein
MIKRLGNFFLLIGLLCLVVFFTSNTFILDASWFFLGGLGLTTLGLLLKRGKRNKKDRRREKRRRGRGSGEDEDGSY